MRDGMDIQETTAVGSFVWIADNFRGGNVGVQQPGEVAERQCDASRIVPAGCDCYPTERSTVAREPNTGSEVVRVASADEILVLELQPSRLGCESPEWLRRAKWLPNSGIACEIEFLFVLDTVRQY